MIKKNDVLKSKSGNYERKVLAIFDGLYALSTSTAHDFFSDWVTLSELERDYVIPESKWEPKDGERYWYILTRGVIDSLSWQGDETDNGIKNFTGVYQTYALAEQALVEIKERLKK